MHKLFASLALAVLAPFGCSNDGIAVAGNGSGTLSVDARIAAESRVDNASTSDGFDTALYVRLTKGGAPVLGATVTIGGGGETVTLTDKNQDGRYTGSRAVYDRNYTLDARLGDDFIEGVALSGPELHSFGAPTMAAQVHANQPLEVSWSPSGSERAQLETKEFNQTDVPDTGSYTVPGASIRGEVGKVIEDRARLVRRTSLTLSGTAGASTLVVSVRNEVGFLVVTP